MFTGTGPKPGSAWSFLSGSAGNPNSAAASAKAAAWPVKAGRRTGTGPVPPWIRVSPKSRSVSSARRNGSTRSYAQAGLPAAAQAAKSSRRARTK